MVKTRSSARVVNAAQGEAAANGNSSDLRTRLKAYDHRARPPKSNNSRNSQALSSGGPGSAQGKDPLAPAISGSRAMYQHPAVSGYNPQDSRSQSMPGSARQNPLYASSMYHYSGSGATLAPMPSPSPTTTLPPFPVHPDVKFKKLPFYDVLAELMKPSTMMPMQAGRMQEGTFIFHLTPQQATEIASGKNIVGTSNKLDYVIQAQLRFCLLETSCEQEDYFPPSVNVKINNKMCPLPNPVPTNKPTPEPKRPPRPVNISSLVKLSPTVANTIHVTWAADFTRAYVLSVFMVRKLTSAELLQRLKNKGTKNPDYTRSLIKEKLSEDYDSEIATTSLRVSLMCPLGKMRMSCPCRPANCPHLQCFDASLFLQMNERKPTWLCPVCDRTAPYDSLVVDGYFQEVLTSARLASECNEIQLHADGNWSAHAPPPRAPPPAAPAINDSVTLIADDLEVIPVDGNNAAKRAAVGDGRTPKITEVLVDLTSDSEDELPLKRKVPLPKSTPPVVETTIKTDDNYTTSSEAVSSSGYRSPGGGAVISLDSPSPPAPASPREHTRTHAHAHEHEHAHEHAAAHAIDALSPHSLSSDICTTNTIDREENESTPTHWAPYADTDRDTHDTYRSESTKASTTEVQTITSRKKTNAQICKEYRERKKLQNALVQNIPAARSDECSETGLLQAKRPKTNAERRKKHYEKQKLKKQGTKKIPKTVKQKNKEYYERKKRIRLLNALNHHSDASRDNYSAEISKHPEEIRNDAEETQQNNDPAESTTNYNTTIDAVYSTHLNKTEPQEYVSFRYIKPVILKIEHTG